MKTLKIIIISFLSLLVSASLFVAVILSVNLIKNAEFYLMADREEKIPGLDEGFVPEGFCSVPDGVLVSGYLNESGQARVYIIKNDGSVSHTDLVNEFYEPFISRASGIEMYDGYMYITGDEGLYMFYYEDVRDGLAETDYYGIIETFVKPEWCAIYDDNLYVGSRDGEAAPEWQKISTSHGSYNDLITVFRLDENVKFAIRTKPICAIASPSNVQGAHVGYDGFVLSTSEEAFDSKLLFYSGTVDGEALISLYAGEDMRAVPIYYLTEAEKTHEISLPPRAEDTAFVDGRLYLLGSCASDKYKYGRFLLLDSFFSLEIKKEYFK